MNSDGIFVRVLGDYGPFSSMGKSIGYQVTIGDHSFLVDCGSPLFQQIGGHGLKTIKGVIITHCHDDHKRWFTDLALFNLYAPDIPHKLPIFTSEAINEGLRSSSGAALNTSLSADSKSVVDLVYDDYIDFHPLGPRPKYRIVCRDAGGGTSSLEVVDGKGETVGPELAKIVISARNGRPRLLFRDPVYNEWIEPESFYPFSSDIFYEVEQNSYSNQAGFSIEAINAPVWHGIPSIGLKFSTADETVIFSADTAHDTELWQALHSEKRPQRLQVSSREFESAAVLHGDINDYIERIWSSERYHEALKAFDNAIVIHDIAMRRSVVHTDYRRLRHTVLARERTILTHSPDKITSEWALSKAEKTFLIRENRFWEVVGDKLRVMDADIYHKEGGRYFAGYRSAEGKTTVFENDGILNLGGPWNWEKGTELYKVDLYEDVGGKYVPKLPEEGESRYLARSDGRVELVTYGEEGSHGVIVEDQRESLAGRDHQRGSGG